MALSFHNLHTALEINDSLKIAKWLRQTIASESYILGKLSYTFLTDKELHKMNMEFLNHNTYTDIITFDYNQDKVIYGEIYISLDRVNENATLNKTDYDNELNRIIVHGLLHLMGYKDKDALDKIEMTKKEDYYLSLLP